MVIKIECCSCRARKDILVPGWWPKAEKYRAYLCYSCRSRLASNNKLALIQSQLEQEEK